MRDKPGNSFETTIKQAEVCKAKEWETYFHKVPFFELPPGHKIAVVPPVTMADARFLIMRPDGERISIYLDLHDNLGYFGEPHWEVYPDREGNNSRVPMNDTAELIKLITWAE